jgi:hypothetical protein
MMPVVRVAWTAGGRHAPIIGAQGHVYAMTNLGLFVFAAPTASPAFATSQTGCDRSVPIGGVVLLTVALPAQW